MSKSKTKLKKEIENLNYIIQAKDKTIKVLKNTCTDLMRFKDESLKKTELGLQCGLFFGMALGLIIEIILYLIKRGL